MRANESTHRESNRIAHCGKPAKSQLNAFRARVAGLGHPKLYGADKVRGNKSTCLSSALNTNFENKQRR